MYFENWQALLAMDGHGPYVWAAYAISVAVLIALVVMPLRRQRKFERDQQQWRRRQQSAQAIRAGQEYDASNS